MGLSCIFLDNTSEMSLQKFRELPYSWTNSNYFSPPTTYSTTLAKPCHLDPAHLPAAIPTPQPFNLTTQMRTWRRCWAIALSLERFGSHHMSMRTSGQSNINWLLLVGLIKQSSSSATVLAANHWSRQSRRAADMSRLLETVPGIILPPANEINAPGCSFDEPTQTHLLCCIRDFSAQCHTMPLSYMVSKKQLSPTHPPLEARQRHIQQLIKLVWLPCLHMTNCSAKESQSKTKKLSEKNYAWHLQKTKQRKQNCHVFQAQTQTEENDTTFKQTNAMTSTAFNFSCTWRQWAFIQALTQQLFLRNKEAHFPVTFLRHVSKDNGCKHLAYK